MSVASAVIDTAIKHAAGRRVLAVRLSVGRMRQVVPESLAFYFDFVTRGTLCEGAKLEMTVVPSRLVCGACGESWEPLLPAFRCPACAAGDVTVVSGDELLVDSIEVEDSKQETREEQSCIA